MDVSSIERGTGGNTQHLSVANGDRNKRFHHDPAVNFCPSLASLPGLKDVLSSMPLTDPSLVVGRFSSLVVVPACPFHVNYSAIKTPGQRVANQHTPPHKIFRVLVGFPFSRWQNRCQLACGCWLKSGPVPLLSAEKLQKKLCIDMTVIV